MLTDEIIAEFGEHGRTDFLQTNGSSFMKRYEGAGVMIDSVEDLCRLHRAYFHAYFNLWFGHDLDLGSCSNPKSVFELIKNRIEERGSCELGIPTSEHGVLIKRIISSLKAYFLHDVSLKFTMATPTERSVTFRVVGIYDRDPKGAWGIKGEFL